MTLPDYFLDEVRPVGRQENNDKAASDQNDTSQLHAFEGGAIPHNVKD